MPKKPRKSVKSGKSVKARKSGKASKSTKNNNSKAAERNQNVNAALVLTGEVMRVVRTHGFIRKADNAPDFTEYFVSGRDMKGAVTGDIVEFVKHAPPREPGGLDEVRITKVIKPSDNMLTGTVVLDEYNDKQEIGISPDSFGSRYPLKLVDDVDLEALKLGDKVSFNIVSRGDKHHHHIAKIEKVYGSSKKARVCVEAYLEEKRISTVFSRKCEKEARSCGEEIDSVEIPNRLDLRDVPIFTIDGADTKDIDDAISIERVRGGYRLGVHIADVSHYVRSGSALDEEAFARGTSVYIADLVVPMLPKALSNGICSLNPQVERFAFSCLMEVAKSGELKNFEFKKSIISSRVQGVYSEINEILKNIKMTKAGTVAKRQSDIPSELYKKYSEVFEQIPVMYELANILKKNREGRCAPSLESAESKIICDPETGDCLDIQRRGSGEDAISEGIIEEFMLLANNAAARLAMEKKFPFVYRVHEAPVAEKLTRLSETLAGLGIAVPELKPTAESLSNALKVAKKLEAFSGDKFAVVNMAVLRSMMKAKYSDEPLGHFGLVMKEYAHFTSPIRRYPDLSIHRILSDYVKSGKPNKKHENFAHESAIKSTFAEMKAVNAERDCNGFYSAEYMSSRIGEVFEGVITGVTETSVFVMLQNTVEGRVSFRSGDRFSGLTGETTIENGVTLANSATGMRYTLGDKVTVKCIGCSVPLGQVDFELA
ncbi:MAG: VacB/RNase II family 3'-5' exoribonuclease [Oscillospiraceae bacterium]|nr:VacB/RNase II family 3'-5' exoribonuclease [Oscillospiraceae bacterium]